MRGGQFVYITDFWCDLVKVILSILLRGISLLLKMFHQQKDSTSISLENFSIYANFSCMFSVRLNNFLFCKMIVGEWAALGVHEGVLASLGEEPHS